MDAVFDWFLDGNFQRSKQNLQKFYPYKAGGHQGIA